MVLLDLRLPKVDGLDVLREIRGKRELDEVPVIILTTSSAEMDVKKAYQSHANSYLVKPNDFQRFDELIKALGSYWLGWNHDQGKALSKPSAATAGQTWKHLTPPQAYGESS